MILDRNFPRMSIEGKAKVEAILSEHQTCQYWGCESTSVNLTQRKVGGNICIYLQCKECGSSKGSALARSEHFEWQTYPTWDNNIRDEFSNKRNKEIEDSRTRTTSGFDKYRKAHTKRCLAYAEWCRTSPDWHDLRDRILRRSGYRCEGCLVAQAVTAHHMTYEFGKLPPAWELRSVCEKCHERLHADIRGQEDEWTPLTVIERLDESA